MHMPKLTKMFTLNVCNFLYINDIPIKKKIFLKVHTYISHFSFPEIKMAKITLCNNYIMFHGSLSTFPWKQYIQLALIPLHTLSLVHMFSLLIHLQCPFEKCIFISQCLIGDRIFCDLTHWPSLSLGSHSTLFVPFFFLTFTSLF